MYLIVRSKSECVSIHQVLCWETSYNGQLVQCSVHRDYLFNCLEQHNKTAVMVDGDVLVTTLPLAYVSYCMPNCFYFGSCGLFV